MALAAHILPLEVKKLLLSPTEAAALLGLGRTTTYGLVRSGALPSVRVGSAIKVRAVDVIEYASR